MPVTKKKADTTAAPAAGPRRYPFDPTKLVWPSPPDIARVHWVDYFAGQKIDYTPAANSKPKASWMDRLAGGQSDAEKFNPKTFPFQLIGPYEPVTFLMRLQVGEEFSTPLDVISES